MVKIARDYHSLKTQALYDKVPRQSISLFHLGVNKIEKGEYKNDKEIIMFAIGRIDVYNII